MSPILISSNSPIPHAHMDTEWEPSSSTKCQKEFFLPSYLGTNSTFDKPQHSTWTILEKLSEEVNQQDGYSYRTYGAASHSVATFYCGNVNDSSQVMLIKVMMQYVSALLFIHSTVPHKTAILSPPRIPYAGTESIPLRTDGAKPLNNPTCNMNTPPEKS